MRADLLLKMGDANGAEEDAKMLQEQCPDNEDILLLVARIYEAKAMHNEAIEAYCRVLDVNPFCLAAFKAWRHSNGNRRQQRRKRRYETGA